ncbi:hypothetical protein DAEQUDRAFT_728162 [Daedalea quercina L-15889]|uniref:Vacuolar import and degradation protein n=1 Tax=Daedalea quercina L-15889 TaxID=1314783 RepID=A0A165PEZ7_9APHY|nr:hypothetical protein DAEQUDRAFT_728162 [Daedalea quercina L-15889]
MPSEHPVPAIHDQQSPDQSQGQVKLCSACHCPLSADSPNTAFFLHGDTDSNETTIVCGPCHSRLVPLRGDAPLQTVEYTNMQRVLLRRAASLQGGHNEAPAAPRRESIVHSAHSQVDRCLDADEEMDRPLSSSPSIAHVEPSTTPVPTPPETPVVHVSARPTPAPIDTQLAHPQPRQRISTAQLSPVQLATPSSSRPRPKVALATSPDPLSDITRLRIRSQGHHCLYPGATFQGTQKSGRNSYDVNVTIVDVDFASSHLCGYLRIRGLTDDWPELTTYFDAEIIGSRYGFLTRNWGATEQEDMVHWARFPAFRHVRHELKKPHLTMKDANRGAVFMRWKEKFLVPDHRVQDINGASFAGFYYVCVDFNPQQSGSASSHSSQSPISSDSSTHLPSSPPASNKPELTSRARRTSVNQGPRRQGRSRSRGVPSSPVATMSGFYFHQNSEPYQQLSLVHVPEGTTSCFEFR